MGSDTSAVEGVLREDVPAVPDLEGLGDGPGRETSRLRCDPVERRLCEGLIQRGGDDAWAGHANHVGCHQGDDSGQLADDELVEPSPAETRSHTQLCRASLVVAVDARDATHAVAPRAELLPRGSKERDVRSADRRRPPSREEVSGVGVVRAIRTDAKSDVRPRIGAIDLVLRTDHGSDPERNQPRMQDDTYLRRRNDDDDAAARRAGAEATVAIAPAA